MLEQAKLKNGSEHIEYICMSIEDLDFPKGSLDVVTTSNLLKTSVTRSIIAFQRVEISSSLLNIRCSPLMEPRNGTATRLANICIGRWTGTSLKANDTPTS